MAFTGVYPAGIPCRFDRRVFNWLEAASGRTPPTHNSIAMESCLVVLASISRLMLLALMLRHRAAYLQTELLHAGYDRPKISDAVSYSSGELSR